MDNDDKAAARLAKKINGEGDDGGGADVVAVVDVEATTGGDVAATVSKDKHKENKQTKQKQEAGEEEEEEEGKARGERCDIQEIRDHMPSKGEFAELVLAGRPFVIRKGADHLGLKRFLWTRKNFLAQ